jgi:GTPase SAR1 family protein
MLVGEGRAGKTALAKSLMGLPFAHTESTCGIEQFRVEVSHAVVGSAWHQCEAPVSELDAAIVALVRDSTVQPKIAAKSTVVVEDRAPQSVSIPDSNDVIGAGSVSAPCEHDESQLAGRRTVEGPVGGTSERLNSSYMTPLKAEAINAALLSSSIFQDSDLIVKLFDFAGQDVFNCLHAYFLTRHGAYAIVFNMNWLSTSSTNAAGALEYLSFWLHSVAMNTRTADQGMAPIFLVGTHKDQVGDESEHVHISELLDATFAYSAAWSSIVENTESGLVYFPVDCTLGSADATMVRLMSLMEQSIRASDYLLIKRPLPWYEALDVLQQVPSPTITYTEAKDKAVQCGVSPDMVTELLSFLRDMGMLMWYNEPGLNETIILDPIAYFVKPVTRVICQPKLHYSKAHETYRKNKREAYDILYGTGLASHDILYGMLSYEGHCANTLTALMLKYGLASCWTEGDRGTAVPVATTMYLIPSLFPEMPCSPKAKKWIDDENVRSYYFIFSLDKSLGMHVLKEPELSSIGFLPKGLFDRLLCIALEWCRDSAVSDSVLSEFSLCKSFAILQALGIWFRMTSIPKYHCIRVDTIEKTDHCSQTIVGELLQRWKAIINTGFRDLQMATFIPFISHTGHHSLLVPLSPSNTVAGVENLVHLDRVSVRYHCFLSYRWGAFDKVFVTALHDHLVRLIVRGRRMRVFFDTSVIQTADSIQQKFFISILSTEIFFPVVSPNALIRMITHDPQLEDNLLIEWLTALVLVKYAPSNGLPNRLPRFICPICFSGPNDDGYFAIRARLSDAVPVATIRKVKELFDLEKIVLSTDMLQRLDGMTVKKIVDGIMEYCCLDMAVTDDIPVAVRKCCIEAMKLFFRADEIMAPAEYLQEMGEL